MRDAVLTDLPGIVALLADDENGRLRERTTLPIDPRYLAAFEEITAAADQRLIVAEHAGRSSPSCPASLSSAHGGCRSRRSGLRAAGGDRDWAGR